MPFARRFLHYSPGPDDFVGELTDRVAGGAWFELTRRGGCGVGELRLLRSDSSAGNVGVGEWVAFEFDNGERWYQGQVKHVRAEGAAVNRLTLAGRGHQLAEVFPGGFGRNVADGVPPHRYADTDLFPDDPDRSDETVDAVSDPEELVRLLVQQYVVPQTDISYDPVLVEGAASPAMVASVKVRGEESAAAILCDLAVRAGGASWGVTADGTFFFLQRRTDLLATFQEGVDVVSLSRVNRRDLIFNRLTLTGGYVYAPKGSSAAEGQTNYRWRGHYLQPASRSTYGDRPFEVTLPWIRTQGDSREFAREFFRLYAEPSDAFLVKVAGQSTLLKPWDGAVRLNDEFGNELFSGTFEAIRVEFDHAPRFRMQLGLSDPRACWPQPVMDERWPIGAPAGEEITFSSSEGSSGVSESLGSSGSGSSSLSESSSGGGSSAP